MKKILFVDDDALLARVYSEKLAEAGFEVLVAADGVAATRQVMEYRPDLVVLDLLMPRFSGVDVLKYIRQHPTVKTTRVVVLSNSFLGAIADEAVRTGVEQMLSKSTATPQVLIETIQKVLAGPEHVAKHPAPPATASASAAVASPGSAASNQTPIQSQLTQQQVRERAQQEFARHTPAMMSGIRQICRELLEAADPATQSRVLENMTRKINYLSRSATMVGCRQPAQLSSAIEALLYYLRDKPGNMTHSCRNSIAGAVTVLGQHLDRFDPAQTDSGPPPAILVVDDNPVTNRVLVQTLSGAGLHTTTVMDPLEAVAALRATPYDMVLLDVDMPGMDGIALCEQMRAMPLHEHTPVLFITAHSDLQTRSRSLLSGGDDFIPKPVLPLELNVKVFTQLLKSRTRGETQLKIDEAD